MRINFLVNEVQGGWEPTDKRLGGTEESIVQWAKELADRGHFVDVFHNKRFGSYAGGYYPYLGNKYKQTEKGWAFFRPRGEYFVEGFGQADIYINVKSSEVSPKGPTLYLTNETNASDLDLSKYLGVIWPSEWAEENIPVNNPRRFILPHGYDPKKIYPGKKVPKQCLYASSPDRGLDTLLRAWPSVRSAHPDATLIVTYGAPEYDIPGVTFLDATEKEMNELYRTSDIWAYPCNGGELYCMTGIKAQAAGCVPVIIPTMALAETVKHFYHARKPEDFEANLNAALYDSEDYRNGEYDESCGGPFIRELLAKEHYPTWADSTDRLEQIIKEVLK